MVEPGQRRTGGSPSSANGEAPTSAAALWWTLGIIAVALLAIDRCSSSTTSPVDNGAMADMNAAQNALGDAIATQAPPPVAALNAVSVGRGEANLRLASVEGLAGEMIYSQNCYDALSRHFSWAKLDTCGAFDAQAVQSLGDNDATGLDKEAAWFESEAAAGRYLKAATSAGEDADGADLRLSDLQARVSRVGSKSDQALDPPAPGDDESNMTDSRAPLELNLRDSR